MHSILTCLHLCQLYVNRERARQEDTQAYTHTHTALHVITTEQSRIACWPVRRNTLVVSMARQLLRTACMSIDTSARFHIPCPHGVRGENGQILLLCDRATLNFPLFTVFVLSNAGWLLVVTSYLVYRHERSVNLLIS